VDRVNVRYFSRADYRWNIQVTLRRRGRSDTKRFVGVSYMESLAVRFGVYGDGLDPHLLAGPNYSARDLATIGDQNFANFSRHNNLATETTEGI
jgi:hypothetical protein